MEAFLLSIAATFVVSLVSFVGIIVLIKKINKRSLILTGLVSFAAGSLIGDVFFHLLPESIEETGYTLQVSLGILAGIVLMIIVEAYIHCSHDDTKNLEEGNIEQIGKKDRHLAKMNLIGDSIHNFLDGIAIAASFLISPAVGLTTTAAIIFHEIPNELAHASVLVYSGLERRKVLLYNFLTALTAVLGAIFVFIFVNLFEDFKLFLIPLAIGQFLYIALADLLPVIHRKSGVKKYLVEIVLFLIGLLLMYALTKLEVH